MDEPTPTLRMGSAIVRADVAAAAGVRLGDAVLLVDVPHERIWFAVCQLEMPPPASTTTIQPDVYFSADITLGEADTEAALEYVRSLAVDDAASSTWLLLPCTGAHMVSKPAATLIFQPRNASAHACADDPVLMSAQLSSAWQGLLLPVAALVHVSMPYDVLLFQHQRYAPRRACLCACHC
ncbi:MAG: hypothetical protein EOO41_03940 [Methanobacteriota archaeon]|nr:MAG: hypothetical protein EOO41_03940 [Euryarchaeota archaeon]